MNIHAQKLPTTAETELPYLDDLAALNKDGGDFIRLLRVLTPSSRPREATLCELKVFSLDLAPRYSALSYCRQPDDGTVAIDVRGSLKASFLITHDLRSAIRAIHRRRQTAWFWIDALCINQLSTREKNNQVPKMREIYEKSYTGLIWLGNTVPRAEADSWYGENRWLDRDRRELACYEALGFTNGKIKQFGELDIAHRAWWCRTWVIQEMILPARLYVCIGLQTMSFDQFVSASHNWYYMFGWPQEKVMVRARKKRLLALQDMKKRWHSGTEHNLDVLELLELSRHTYATDAKDNVYGVLGLITPQDKQAITVDYSRTTSQIYADMTIMLIKKYQSLDLIMNCFWKKNERSQDGLPSWVIDYGAGRYGQNPHPFTKALHPKKNIAEFGYKAGNGTPVCIGSYKDASKLHLEAVVLEAVDEILVCPEYSGMPCLEVQDGSPWANNEHRDTEPWMPRWLGSVLGFIQSSMLRVSQSSDPRRTLRRVDDIFHFLMSIQWGDLVCFRSKTVNNVMLDDILSYAGDWYREDVQEELESRNDFFPAIHRGLQICAEGVFFITERGFVGWAPCDLRQTLEGVTPSTNHGVLERDIIVVPCGASMPWVLRETGVEGEYRLITDCVVPGIMDGELMALVESGQLQTQRFTLV
jgi:hypothetical protein